MRRSDGEFTTNDTLADRIESHDIEVKNGTATTTFTVADGESVTLTLANYQKVGPGWNPQTESQQQFVDSDTETFDSGTHTLSVDLPTTDMGEPAATTTVASTETATTATSPETTTTATPTSTTETETSTPSETDTPTATATTTETATPTPSTASVTDGPGDDLNCGDFPSKQAAQRNLDNNPNDPNQLDGDNEGEACDAGVNS